MTKEYQRQSSHNASRSLLDRLMPGLHHLQMDTGASTAPNGVLQTTFSLVPGHGNHVLRYKHAFISITRERTSKSFDTHGQPFETMKLTTLYFHRHVFEEMFRAAHANAQRRIEGKTVIYTLQNMSWMPLGEPKRKRPFESVVLGDGLAESVVNDITEFLDMRTWYLDRGIPYRRGYLLHGPPGTGKTSFVQALAGKLDFNIAMLSLSQHGLHDDLLSRLLLNVPPRTIVLLEDADAAFSNRRQKDGDGYSGAQVTFSGLLNALDGVASAEERIVFMTTNHVERLDDALVRPGRVDCSVRIGEASRAQIQRMWERFYDAMDESGDKRRLFMDRIDGLQLAGKVSTAQLQGLFLLHKDDPDGAIESVKGLASQTHTPQSSTSDTLPVLPETKV